jgi:hypothetical protein
LLSSCYFCAHICRGTAIQTPKLPRTKYQEPSTKYRLSITQLPDYSIVIVS